MSEVCQIGVKIADSLHLLDADDVKVVDAAKRLGRWESLQRRWADLLVCIPLQCSWRCLGYMRMVL